MSRGFYQENWGRGRNGYNAHNNEDNYSSLEAMDMKGYNEGIREGNIETNNTSTYAMQYGQEQEKSYGDEAVTGNEVMSTRAHQFDEGLGRKNRKKIRQYDKVAEAVLEGPYQTRCCPFDVYGINTYKPIYTKINVVKDHIEDLYIPFTVSVTIPVGFIIPMGGSYDHNLAMDKHNLSVNTMTQYYVYADINAYSCDNPEVVKMQVSILNGPIYYNLTVGNFVPAQPIQDANQATTTYFNARGCLTIDKILGYTPFGYKASATYSIDVIAEKETITLPGGKCVTKKARCEEYQYALADPGVERVLHFSYILVVKSVN